MSVWLSHEDVSRLTDRVKYAAQKKVLRAKGIAWIEGGKGEPLVSVNVVDGKPKAVRNRARWENLGAP